MKQTASAYIPRHLQCYKAPCKIWKLPFLDGKITVTMGSQIAAPSLCM